MFLINSIVFFVLFIASTSSLTWSGYSPSQNATYPLASPISVSIELVNVSSHDVILAYNIDNGSLFTVWDTNSSIIHSVWWNSTICFNTTGKKNLDFFFLEICADNDDIKTPAQRVSFFVQNQTNITNMAISGGQNTSWGSIQEPVWKIDVGNVYRQRKCRVKSSNQGKLVLQSKSIYATLFVIVPFLG